MITTRLGRLAAGAGLATVIATIVGGMPAHCADPEICSMFER
jgi:hypothetical protein